MRSLAILLLLGLMTLQPSAAQTTRLFVETPINGSSVDGPLVLTGRATPNSVVEVRGGLTGSTEAGPNGRWTLVLEPAGRRNVNLEVQAWHRWSGWSDRQHVSYAFDNRTAYYNYNRRTVQDSLTDPYYDYPSPYDQRQYYAVMDPTAQSDQLLLSVNSPTNGSSMVGDFTLAGTGTPGAEVIVQGSLNGRTVVQRDGRWHMPLSLRGLAPGTVVHLTAIARDQFGNQSPASQLKYAVKW